MSLRREWLRNNKKSDGITTDYTKSTYFIMPMLDYEVVDFLSVDERFNHLINCYLDIDEDRIVIVVDNVQDKAILSLLRDNATNPYYLGSTTDDEGRELVLFYTIPKKYRDDYEIFLTSKYSKMSEGYKRKLTGIYGRETWKEDYRPNQFDVIYPTTFKRKQLAEHFKVDISLIDEVSSRLNMDYETYKNIKELQKISLIGNTNIIEVNKECEKQ